MEALLEKVAGMVVQTCHRPGRAFAFQEASEKSALIPSWSEDGKILEIDGKYSK